MEVFKILQIGDVHYSDSENFEQSIDNKDGGFPASLAESIATAPIQAVFREVAHVIETKGIHLISFMGDFTTRGDTGTLHDCLRYLRGLFPVPWNKDDAPQCQVLIGNHDVDRKLDPDSDGRFDAINTIFEAEGFPQACVSTPQALTLEGAGVPQVQVFGLNSCKGCGQLRLLGGIIERTAGAAIKAIIADPTSPPGLLNEIYESIDTPAIDDRVLAELLRSISLLPEAALPVICAHHNLLPQETPRLAPYTEMINAGSIRVGLVSLNRPLLYLHGHLHTDPVEVIRVPGREKSAIVSISAPLFRAGFNLIEIAFSDAVPLGCRITPYRVQGNRVMREQSTTVPLWTAAEGLRLATRQGRNVMSVLRPDTTTFRSDLLRDIGMLETTLDDALLELQWLGVVEISDTTRPSYQWRVTRAI